MPPRKSIDPLLTRLSKLRIEPVPTSFRLSVDQDRPESQALLQIATESGFVDCKCSCEKARRRFDPSNYVISDGVFALSFICSTQAAVERVVYQEFCKLKLRDQTTSRQAILKGHLC